jgi:hypothetical protein
VLGLAAVLAAVFVLPVATGELSLFRAQWWDHAPSAWGPAPASFLVHEILASGELPLWNPRNALGAPLAVELPSVYSPFHWPAFAWPSRWTWEAILVLRFWVSGWCRFCSWACATWSANAGAGVARSCCLAGRP